MWKVGKSAFRSGPKWRSRIFVEHRQTHEFWCSLYQLCEAKLHWVKLLAFVLARRNIFITFSITYCMSFCCLLGGSVFYYKFGTIYYCLVFVLCLRNGHFFFLLWIKCWDDRRSFQYGLVKYLLFLLFSVQDFGPLFFPLMSQCSVQHVSAISFVRLFKTKFVLVSSYKNKLDI